MSDFSYIPLESILSDWLDETGHDGFFNTDIILKNAQDQINKLVRGDQAKQYITLLNIENHTALLPKNFKSVIQAAYNIFPNNPCKRSEVVEMTKKLHGAEGCKIVARIECPKCHQEKCGCDLPFIEIEPDYLWMQSHPEYMIKHTKYMYSYTNMNSYPHRKFSNYHPQFQLMGVSSGNFHNLQYHISDCLNLNVDTDISYDIDLPNIVANFKEGQVLLSYFGFRIDETGGLMIPNVPEAIESIVNYIEYREAYRVYRKSREPRDRIFYQESKQEYWASHKRAVSILEMPSEDKMNMIWKNHMMKLLPYDDYEENFNRKQDDRFNYPGASSGLIF